MLYIICPYSILYTAVAYSNYSQYNLHAQAGTIWAIDTCVRKYKKRFHAGMAAVHQTPGRLVAS